MITSPDMLRRDTVHTLGQINEIITDVEDEAKKLDIPPTKMRDASGGMVLTPLLLAKVMAINTLVELNQNPRGRR